MALFSPSPLSSDSKSKRAASKLTRRALRPGAFARPIAPWSARRILAVATEGSGAPAGVAIARKGGRAKERQALALFRDFPPFCEVF